MKIKPMKRVCGWLLVAMVLPLLAGCTTSDDVQAIFTGKAWKLTYISRDMSGKWYPFNDVEDKNFDQYNKGEKSFVISFTGGQTDHLISGKFTGMGTSFSGLAGNWSANGESNAFSSTVTGGTNLDKNDKIASKIIDALSKIDTYKGDETFLYLYYTYEKDRVYLAFTRVKN